MSAAKCNVSVSIVFYTAIILRVPPRCFANTRDNRIDLAELLSLLPEVVNQLFTRTFIPYFPNF